LFPRPFRFIRVVLSPARSLPVETSDANVSSLQRKHRRHPRPRRGAAFRSARHSEAFVRQFVRTFVCGSALLALIAIPASAQEAPAVDLGIGYQWLHAPDQAYPLGFNLDVSGNLTDNLRWVGELGWSRDSEGDDDFGVDGSLTATSFAAGVRWAPAAAAYHPYAQVLLGAQRDSINVDSSIAGFDDSDTNFILQPGVGVTVPAGANWGVFGQADWRRVFYEGDGANDFRFVVGARINLK
jgi:hypothetical protein